MQGWQKWYAVTRPVSSILGCQHPRFSFQIATIVFSNHAQQQTVDNGSVKPAPRIETSHKSFLWTDNKQTHFWSIALFLYRLLWVKNVQYKCIAIETQRTVSFRYWGIELRGSFLAVVCLFGHLRTYFGGLAVVHILRRCKEVYCKTNLEIVGSDWMTCYQGVSSQTLAKPITGPRPQSSPSAFLGQLLSHCYTTTIVAPILKWTKAFSSVTTHRRHNWAMLNSIGSLVSLWKKMFWFL